MKNQTFKIGTRASLLAVTQCTLLKNDIEEKTGLNFELKKIITEGDQKTEKPLWQLDGKDFFTKELDTALLKNEIDMVVHSYKDLGSERPENIELAAITERKYSHDILLIRNTVVSTLSEKEKLIVGTSSPRRIVNIESSLSSFLPNAKSEIEIKCEMLRGNVNTRIQKLKDGNYDAIVLALAGLERLASKEDSKQILEDLLEGLNFIILPQMNFPSSASQGALAVEINDQRSDSLKEELQSVHHKQSADEIERERIAFNSYGGGCHLAVGIHVKKAKDYFIHIHKGQHEDRKIYKLELEGYDYSQLKGMTLYPLMGANDFLIEKASIKSNEASSKNTFVTSSHCFHNIIEPKTLWASGQRTMKKMIALGFWVNGSAESLGHEQILNFKNSEAIKILTKNADWTVLTNDHSKSPIADSISSYTRTISSDIDNKKLDQLLSADILYWSSTFQFDQYTQKYPELLEKKHCTGLGKTYDGLKEKGIEIIPTLGLKFIENKL